MTQFSGCTDRPSAGVARLEQPERDERDYLHGQDPQQRSVKSLHTWRGWLALERTRNRMRGQPEVSHQLPVDVRMRPNAGPNRIGITAGDKCSCCNLIQMHQLEVGTVEG